MATFPLDLTERSIQRLSYGVLITCCVVGPVSLAIDGRAALLPAAVVFGWSQIGGL
jgi:hypothetical protein